MSDARVTPLLVATRLADGGFQPARFPAAVAATVDAADAAAGDDDAFARGVEEGTRAAEQAFAAERESLLRLVAAAAALQPEPSEELPVLIGETVMRLVQEIVGNVSIDSEGLIARCRAAAALVAEADMARTLAVHPADAALLANADIGLAITADATLARGDVRIDCSAGWIESGTALYLDALRAELGVGGDA